MVFKDDTLLEMARVQPRSLEKMLDISGVGAKKLEQYGEEFLGVIVNLSST